MSEIIPLANGKSVTLDEFVTWTRKKQAANLRDKGISDETRLKLAKGGKGRPPPNKGIPLSAERKAIISARNKGTPSPFKGKPTSAEQKAKAYAAYWAKHVRQIMTPRGIFPSAKDAAVAFGMTSQGLRNRLKTQPTEYYYVETKSDAI